VKIFAVIENDKVANTIIAASFGKISNLLPTETLIESTDFTGTARIGADVVNGRFMPECPYASWTYDSESNLFLPPTEMPTGEPRHYWSEETLSWIEVIPPEPDEAPE
jgi:hypothetical protein